VDCGGGCENVCKVYWQPPALLLPDAGVSAAMAVMGFLVVLLALSGSYVFFKKIYPHVGP
jgi:hypothetical protein